MLLFDQSWTFEASLALLLIVAHLDKIEAQVPPSFLQPYYNHLKAAAVHHRRFVALALSGIEDADTDLFASAAAEAQEGHRDLNRAEATLLDICL